MAVLIVLRCRYGQEETARNLPPSQDVLRAQTVAGQFIPKVSGADDGSFFNANIQSRLCLILTERQVFICWHYANLVRRCGSRPLPSAPEAIDFAAVSFRWFVIP